MFCPNSLTKLLSHDKDINSHSCGKFKIAGRFVHQAILRRKMKLTRDKHLSYLVSLMPWLILALGLQCYAYLQWAPREIAIDVTIFMGIGLILATGLFAGYDQFHQIQLHRHHMHIKFLDIDEEILYRNIQFIDIEESRHGFYNVLLTLKDGTEYKLWYLDDISGLQSSVKAAA